jgi:quinol monooxygenase YgiN
MILITARMTVAPGREADFVDAARAVIEQTASEPGCLAYDCSRDVLEPSRFVFVEQWQDGAAIRAHGASEHFAAFLTLMDGVILDQTTLLHTVEKTRTL